MCTKSADAIGKVVVPAVPARQTSAGLGRSYFLTCVELFSHHDGT